MASHPGVYGQHKPEPGQVVYCWCLYTREQRNSFLSIRKKKRKTYSVLYRRTWFPHSAWVSQQREIFLSLSCSSWSSSLSSQEQVSDCPWCCPGSWGFQTAFCSGPWWYSVFVDHLCLFQLLIIIQNSGLRYDFFLFYVFLNVLFPHIIMFYLFIFMYLFCV